MALYKQFRSFVVVGMINFLKTAKAKVFQFLQNLDGRLKGVLSVDGQTPAFASNKRQRYRGY